MTASSSEEAPKYSSLTTTLLNERFNSVPAADFTQSALFSGSPPFSGRSMRIDGHLSTVRVDLTHHLNQDFPSECVRTRRITPLGRTWMCEQGEVAGNNSQHEAITVAKVIPEVAHPRAHLARIFLGTRFGEELLITLQTVEQLHRIREKYQINGLISASEERC